ncbi:hypothetical protein EHQ05_04070 [Leptospira yasudae]|uniref:Uncharacterized protein n=1 Tax=Leptospira yasudae TaxID=2202201 RepID=A0ABX9M5G3_9LEPT|nr:hypothetical protein DLM77_03205 [Leptospira yasudae]TGK30144.1 hypothetical protein EHQ05_04070 [Leptospira yasudae]TGM04475.1 hypothetical protein EHQ86_14665 [Leptospira yasudae]TGN01000.1 hypothetical protein EHR10_04980 [Leptospira yasudae]
MRRFCRSKERNFLNLDPFPDKTFCASMRLLVWLVIFLLEILPDLIREKAIDSLNYLSMKLENP